MPSVSSLIDLVRNDVVKLFRFAAVSAITVPIGLALYWLLLQTDLHPAVANVMSVTLATIPNYLLNRYWVWSKRGADNMTREIAAFWAIAFFTLTLSTVAVAIANQYTDTNLVFLAANFCSFGVMWLVKFFILEKYLFAHREPVEVSL